MWRAMVCAGVVGVLGLAAMAPASKVLYSNGFETTDNAGFVPDASLPAVDPTWTMETVGTATILGGGGANSTAQFLRLGGGAVLNRSFASNTAVTSARVIWIDGYFRGAGSETTLAEADYPTSNASAIVHFSQASGAGIELANGAGNGTFATVSTGLATSASQWYRVTLRLDFTAKQWDAYVVGDGNSFSRRGLGFVSNAVNSLNGFKNLAQDSADFDGFRVVAPVKGDANGDSAVDSADLVELAEVLASEPTAPTTSNPIFWDNADVNGDGTLNTSDRTALLNWLLRIP